jgi:hypothetical protein
MANASIGSRGRFYAQTKGQDHALSGAPASAGPTIDAAAIEAEVDQIRSLDIDAPRQRWRSMFGVLPPKGPAPDFIALMIADRFQEEAYGREMSVAWRTVHEAEAAKLK